MCGIFGYWLNRPLKNSEIEKSINYISYLNHRGPNNLGFWYDKNKGIFLGHTRLSIIGLSKENNQPLKSRNSVITYNGELYNYQHLKAILKSKGYNFKTSTDTEVIQNAWDLWGKSSLNYFDGMYAFAIFENNQLYLVNDIFGEKPIYYLKNNNGFYFASEIQILVKFLNIKKSLNDYERYYFMGLGYLPSPSTGYKNLKYLTPASIINIDNNINFKIEKYWKLDNNKKDLKRNLDKIDIKNIKNLLIESLEKRLISDVNIGLFLSSGIDSSLVAALTKKELNKDLHSYTVSFPDGIDESLSASKIAEYLNIKNHIICNETNEEDKIDELFNIYGTLNDNLTALSIFNLSKFAKDHITVALGGIGGDELFFGYNKYNFAFKNRYLYKYNLKFLYKFIDFLSKSFNLKKINNYNNYINCNDNDRFLAIKDLNIKKLLLNKYKKISILNNETKNNEFFERIRNFDINDTLPNSYLTSIDRGSMKASIEVRTPYLNKALFEYINTFQPELFMRNKKKFIQKKIISEYLPDHLISNEKKGFVMPINSPIQFSNNNKFFKYLKDNNLDESKISESQKFILRLKMIYNFDKKYA